ncbi:MAG: HAMP domain-containing histidine kinase [Myxococcaceae bacterium]|nr:HAMP domain-containing histidine kinase [Myxococcaceae bacterium]
METLEMLRSDPLAEKVTLETDIADVSCRGDPDQLRQVLINLVRNALAAAGPGGKVRITVGERDGRSEIRVWDSAGSIPASDLVRVFEPFYTTKAGGTGLGLSTAHSIVHAHHGTIVARSAPQTGTEFLVELPRAEEELRADSGR